MLSKLAVMPEKKEGEGIEGGGGGYPSRLDQAFKIPVAEA